MDVFTLAAKLTLDSKGFANSLKNGESMFQRFGDKVKKGLTSVAKVGAMSVSAAAGALVPLVKSATEAYANYEQLVGGVETLFKDSAAKVQGYADVAYKTAGLSANEYMETATSFSAALIAGLRGNTEAAADIADMAIQDMSDNANKMGTDMSAIQSAYQGFAKQNYTMLDNLKLGYGGTQKEMERLLKDAQKLTGQKYDISRLADVYKAIHAIQENIGITGTTAKEANETISGSISSFKAAWENMLVAVSSGDKDISKASRTLVSTGKTVLHNVVPAIKRSVKGFGSAFKELAPMIGKELPGLIGDIVPGMIEGGWELIKGLGSGLVEAARNMKWPSWGDVKAGAVALWDGIKAGVAEFGGLIFGKNEKGEVKWPTWDDVATAAGQAWETIKKGVADFGGLVFGKNEKGEVNWPTIEELQDAAKDLWGKLKTFVANVFNLGGKLIFGTDKTNGEVKWPSIDDLKEGAKDLWGKLKTFVANAFNLGGKLLFGENTDGEVKWPDIETLKETASKLWTELTDHVKALPALVFGENSVVSSALTNAFSFVQDVGNWIIENADAVALGMGAIMAAFAIDKLLAVNPLLLGIAAGAALVVTNWNKVKEVIGEVQQAVEEFQRSLEPVNNWFLQLQGGGKGQLVQGQVAELTTDYRKVKAIERNRGSEAGNQSFETFKNKFAKELREAGASAEEIEQALNNIDMSWTVEQMDAYINSLSTANTEAQTLKEALDAVAGNYEVNINIHTNGTIPTIPFGGGPIPNPKYMKPKAIGDWNVPYDNYPAMLHKNEMVLTATQARKYREGSGGFDIAGFAQAVIGAVREGMESASVNAYVNGRRLTSETNRGLYKDMKSRRFSG